MFLKQDNLNRIVLKKDDIITEVVIPKENLVWVYNKFSPKIEIGFKINPDNIFKLLKFLIIPRDEYKCQLCNKTILETDLVVHHIDYNHNNNDPENLITLCKGCHYLIHFFSNKKHVVRKLIKIMKKRGTIKTEPNFELAKCLEGDNNVPR